MNNGLNISSDKLDMLSKISVMAENLTGAFSLRVDGSPFAKGSSPNVTISSKTCPASTSASRTARSARRFTFPSFSPRAASRI